MQLSRHQSQNRQFGNNSDNDVFSIGSRFIKQKDRKMEPPLDYATLSHIIDNNNKTKKRPQSLNKRVKR